MTIFGISLSSEEHGPSALVRYATLAAEAGLEAAWVSDHFHPWVDEQGESPMVWPVLGGIAATQPQMRLGTGVTCPTIRVHPAICAQAAATVAAMCPGGFFFGVGTGENLNEHVTGAHWPPIDVRLEMLEEAVDVMRQLWTGEVVNHHGRHYTVEHARLYTLPDEPPPVYVSAFGPKATGVAARIGDGFVSTAPEAEAVQQYRDHGGTGPAVAGPKVCWAATEDEARTLAYRLWPNMGLPGQLSQDLPTPEHFMQASELVPEDAVSSIPLGPDPDQHAESLKAYVDAGFDELYVQQIGDDQEGWLRFFTKEVLPRL